jgi:hypothetical protein
MYRRTDRQKLMFDASVGLSDPTRARLGKTWAGPFQEKVLPILFRSEDSFASLYCDDNGRPNWSIARRLGICLLQELFDFTDDEIVDSVAFDVRFQYALDLTPEAAYLSRRSLGDFRRRLVQNDPEMRLCRRLFDEVANAAIADLSLSVASQRMDSTQITSNIRSRGRINLFGTTLRHFLRQLAKSESARLDELPADLREWHRQSDETSDFGWGKGSKSLQTLAEWAVAVVHAFIDDEDIASWESWELVRRIVREHCQLLPPEAGPDDQPTTGDRVVVKVAVMKAPDNAGSSLQSPYDPDATHGYKGTGYSVQLAESTGNDQTEILTDYEVRPANTSDWGQTTPALDRLESVGRKPEKMITDGGYPSGAALVEAEARGVELHAPVTANALPGDSIGRDKFAIDESGRIVACPAGHAPLRHSERKRGNAEERTMHAFFRGDVCRACPLLGRCVARGEDGKNFMVESRRELVLRDQVLTAQRDPVWQEAYRIRAGIEATNSELKRRHGLGRLRVRRASRVRLAVSLKLTACNAKRWIKAVKAA